MKEYILALDQGTTSSRAILFDRNGKIVSAFRNEFKQHFPKPGWVEHDPYDILASQVNAAKEAIRIACVSPKKIAAIGIANQRETTILWERKTGKPVYNAIVWQCRRTADICRRFSDQGFEKDIHGKTGLTIDPYFSGTKLVWLLEQIEGAKEKAGKGELCFGTVDSWLLYNLTGNHSTDVTNASRTLLFNINTCTWDNDILSAFNIPQSLLPRVCPSSGDFGLTKKEIFGESIPVLGVAGDQQAALFGQCCFEEGDVKNTYGTGCFTLMNTGTKPLFSKHQLLTTIAWDTGEGCVYALEGSVFIGGAVIQWLRDSLKIIANAEETGKIAESVPDTKGVYMVPSFVGLGSPWWDPEVRGAIFGLTRGAGQPEIVRAALESIAFQTRDLIYSMEEELGKKIRILKVDGGASGNNFLMQFQADILGIVLKQPEIPETTALGAAYLAGIYSSVYKDISEISKNWQCKNSFSPGMDENERIKRIENWEKAVKAARLFV